MKTSNIKDKVIRTAEKLFVEKGYFHTSIQDIVEESEVSIGSIYHYFKSKQELARHIFEESSNLCVDELYRKFQQESSVEQNIKSYVSHSMKTTEEKPYMMRFLLLPNHNEIHDGCAPSCNIKNYNNIKNIVSEGIKSGIIKDFDPDILTASSMGIVQNVIKKYLEGALSGSILDYLEDVQNLVWDSIKK